MRCTTLRLAALRFTGNGHPDDKLGFVVGAGFKLNAPMIGQGDFFQAQVNYTQGALRYIFQTPNSNWGKVEGSNARLWRAHRRCVRRRTCCRQCIRPQADHRLERQRGLRALLESALATSLYGGYAPVSYNDHGNAIASALEAAGQPTGPAAIALPAATMTGAPGGSVRAPSGTSPRTSTWAST